MNILGILILAFAAQQPRPASVEGVVRRAGTSEPISRAVVELLGSNDAKPLAIATGADGRFEFRNLPAGRYQLTVSRNGYLDSAYGQRGPNGTGRALQIVPGQTLRDIQLVMIASGVISGCVFDNSGEPLANVPVRALKYSYLDGQRTLTPVKTDVTDDRGEYRLFWLAPGLYYVSAVPQMSSGADALIVMAEGHAAMRMDANGVLRGEGSSSAERLGEADVPFYYPGTSDPQSALPVDLRSGAELGGIDFTLARVKTRRVGGVVIDGFEF